MKAEQSQTDVTSASVCNLKAGSFPVTRWSVVDAVGDLSTNESFKAVSELCETYWYPLYGFLRGSGSSKEDAQDLIQDFLSMAVQRNLIQMADPGKGKLRTFLLNALIKYRAKVYRSKCTIKRGGQVSLVHIDRDWAEGRYSNEVVDESNNPEKAFDQRWASMVLESAFEQLHEEFAAKGKIDEYEVLKNFLAWNSGDETYASAAKKMAISEGNVKVKVMRMRRRLRELLEESANRWANPSSEADLVEELKMILG
ncbi:MAG: hypothetical protein P1V20_23620, partial [Verrucomicrobiales bacterium]|nr:hypothetical protein [Verrucomicrobiales bacterium]